MIQKVRKFLRHSWLPDLTGGLQQFKWRNDSLFIIDECLMFADHVVVPSKLRKAVLKQLHSGHPGINRMKAIARSVMYWPNLDWHQKDSQELSLAWKHRKIYLGLCRLTLTYPQQPWSRIHMDFAGSVNGQSFLVVVDAHSKWPEIFPMKNSETHSTITILRVLFSQYGLSENNGMELNSHLSRSVISASQVA